MNHDSPLLHPQPQGFLSLAKSVGIKDDTLDLTVIHSSVRARAAAVFTRSRFPGAPVMIGRALPMDKIRAGLQGIRGALHPNNLELAARAIMTTDAYPKYTSRQVGSAVIAGIAKGAGMIEPNMATMLAYVLTDAELPPQA